MNVDLIGVAKNVAKTIVDEVSKRKHKISAQHVGKISRYYGGVAKVEKLPGLGIGEEVTIGDAVPAMTMDVEEKSVSIILLRRGSIKVGAPVFKRHTFVAIPVGETLLGRILSPLGDALDEKKPPQCEHRFLIERPAPAIIERIPVQEPVQTGIKAIDALIPIGHGQRELILGDRQTGKTAVAVDTILNQKGKNVICIYCSIGQSLSSLANVIAKLEREKALPYTVVIVAKKDDPPGARFIAPYAATSIAEFFCEMGRKVIIVYDDLTVHARSYREITLLLQRPPGREAYPGDIFYVHARMLERAANRKDGGSITALPIIETQEKNISAYIPTNLISITDGQIFLSPDLFEKGFLPAINVGQSVSRIGGKAQFSSMRKIASDLKLQYAQFEEQESFVKFGTQVEEKVQRSLERGKRIRACLKQFEGVHVSLSAQLMIFLSLQKGLLDNVPLDKIEDAEKELREHKLPESIEKAILKGNKLDKSQEEEILRIAGKIIGNYETKEEA